MKRTTPSPHKSGSSARYSNRTAAARLLVSSELNSAGIDATPVLSDLHLGIGVFACRPMHSSRVARIWVDYYDVASEVCATSCHPWFADFLVLVRIAEHQEGDLGPHLHTIPARSLPGILEVVHDPSCRQARGRTCVSCECRRRAVRVGPLADQRPNQLRRFESSLWRIEKFLHSRKREATLRRDAMRRFSES